ncbi:MAG TPA: hypothetical protein VEC01_11820 [Noviherbaspirillum sp.]|uniref:hypothetical protein n=1 Tax=Noviherbaspirillum sp. TaxID=1926288 RepID=UPI002D4BDAF4|nr:hypothetical protein [Noviherbaspirillum sp.]HYD96006.1 hypothetical protein [Noviherbaspirillum sp.]
MKSFFVPVVLAAALSGCAVVAPYERPYSTYSPAYIYDAPYAMAPGYAVPAPAYGPPIYVGPPIRFSFGLSYRSGGGRHFYPWQHQRRFWGHGSHGFRGGFHGFRGRGGGWRR